MTPPCGASTVIGLAPLTVQLDATFPSVDRVVGPAVRVAYVMLSLTAIGTLCRHPA